MNLLVLDTETTGLLDDENAEVIEAAVALFNVETRSVLAAFGGLVPFVVDVPEAAAVVHGVTTDRLRAAADSVEDEARNLWNPLAVSRTFFENYKPIAVLAHNAEFDRGMVARHDAWWDTVPWVCSQRDIEYPRAGNYSRKLQHLAVDYGLVAIQTHRALDDVLMLCNLLAEVEDLESQVHRALKPRALFVSLAPFSQKDVVKEHGFRWNAEEAPNKTWSKVLPADTPTDKTTDRPFRLRKIRDL